MIQSTNIHSTAVTGSSAALYVAKSNVTIQTKITGTGTISAVVTPQGSLDGTTWSDLATINISDTTPVGYYNSGTSCWVYYRVSEVLTPGVGTITSVDTNLSRDN